MEKKRVRKEFWWGNLREGTTWKTKALIEE
jgi:hypothetical protein